MHVHDVGRCLLPVGERVRLGRHRRIGVGPRGLFVRATDNWIEPTARFVVPVRTARAAMDDISRHVVDQLRATGIEVASDTSTVTVKRAPQGEDVSER